MLVCIKGAGDLASGIAVRLHRSRFDIVMTDLPVPTAVRRTVAFSEAIRLGTTAVEDVKAKIISGEIEVPATKEAFEASYGDVYELD